MKKMCVWDVANIIFLLLMAVTVCLISLTGVWGRFYTTAVSVDGAKVAKWDIKTSVNADQLNDLVLSDDNTSANYIFSVTSKSETAVCYDIVIILPSSPILTDEVSFTINGSTATNADFINSTYTFSNVGFFDANGGSNTHILTVAVSEINTSVILPDITIQVRATQTD